MKPLDWCGPCWFFKGLNCMYRLRSPGCHCLKGDCFLTKLKKYSAMVCFPPDGCLDHSSGHIYMLSIKENKKNWGKWSRKKSEIKRQKRRKEMDKGGRRGFTSIHPENMFCVHISRGKACHILPWRQERNMIIGVWAGQGLEELDGTQHLQWDTLTWPRVMWLSAHWTWEPHGAKEIL